MVKPQTLLTAILERFQCRNIQGVQQKLSETAVVLLPKATQTDMVDLQPETRASAAVTDAFYQAAVYLLDQRKCQCENVATTNQGRLRRVQRKHPSIHYFAEEGDSSGAR